MQLLALPFPQIDPVALSLGPVEIRWYALAYVVGILLGLWLAEVLVRRKALFGDLSGLPRKGQLDGFVIWAAIGIVLGGRLGYVLFYQSDYYLDAPMEIFKVWRGGMSFHGGFLGVVLAGWLFAKRYKLSPLRLGDLLASVAPVGLFFGRLANFINGELWGRVTDVSWAFVFPYAGDRPRHPSQLYEAALEGLLLFALMMLLVWRFRALARPGLCTGVFLVFYGLARMLVEQFREPDAHLGFIVPLWQSGISMGQLLSLPMILLGVWLLLRIRR